MIVSFVHFFFIWVRHIRVKFYFPLTVLSFLNFRENAYEDETIGKKRSS